MHCGPGRRSGSRVRWFQRKTLRYSRWNSAKYSGYREGGFAKVDGTKQSIVNMDKDAILQLIKLG